MPDLEIDQLDMFFMHGAADVRQLDPEFIKMGQEIRSRGIARHFGFSCHMGNVVDLLNKAATIGSDDINTIMFRYNFAMYGDLELNKAIDACKNAGIGLIAMKTMASVPDDKDEVKRFQSENYSLSQAKLKAVWADDRIDAAVSEMTNVEQVAENTDAAISTEPLAMKEFMQLNHFAARTAESRCQGCSHICEDAVDGDVQIADTLRYLMYAECYGKADRARELYASMPLAARAPHPTRFTEASRACPQGIDIGRALERAERVLG